MGLAQFQRRPSAIEVAADQSALAYIRSVCGAIRGQLIINYLLAYDAYFVLYKLLKTPIGWRPGREISGPTAVAACRAAIDMFEAYERVGIRRAKTWLEYLYMLLVPVQMWRLGDLWQGYLGSLELAQGSLKRCANTICSKRLKVVSQADGTMRVKAKKTDGPEDERKTVTRGYSTALAYQVMTRTEAVTQLGRSDRGGVAR